MNDRILLGHGSGGQLSQNLIADIFISNFGDQNPEGVLTDSAILNIESSSVAFTTDSYVVDPIFFPGGNIGKLAVCGTVNDLSVSGAKPKYLTASFIIEEGFDIEKLRMIASAMADTAKTAGVRIVAGDTKIVNKGKCDKVFINTAGIGILEDRLKPISFGSGIKPGDKVIINGTIGDHAIAVLTARNDIKFTTPILSDCAPLNHMIGKVLKVSDKIRFMRDATRGGLAAVMCELAGKKPYGIRLFEMNIPVNDSVKGMCEIFGFDSLYLANEGKVVMIVGEEDAEKVVQELRKDEFGHNACIIGEVTGSNAGKVIIETEIGGSRIVNLPVGEQLPRIC